jgi:hypothetical protein
MKNVYQGKIQKTCSSDEYKTFEPLENTIRRGIGRKKKSRDGLMWVIIHENVTRKLPV